MGLYSFKTSVKICCHLLTCVDVETWTSNVNWDDRTKVTWVLEVCGFAGNEEKPQSSGPY